MFCLHKWCFKKERRGVVRGWGKEYKMDANSSMCVLCNKDTGSCYSSAIFFFCSTFWSITVEQKWDILSAAIIQQSILLINPTFRHWHYSPSPSLLLLQHAILSAAAKSGSQFKPMPLYTPYCFCFFPWHTGVVRSCRIWLDFACICILCISFFRQHKDVALVNLANILHRAHFSADAAILAHAALDHTTDLFTSHYTLGNIYAVSARYLS